MLLFWAADAELHGIETNMRSAGRCGWLQAKGAVHADSL